MKRLFGNCGNVFYSATDHFIFLFKICIERDLGLTKLRKLADICIGIITMIYFSQSVPKADFFVEHKNIMFKKNKISILNQKVFNKKSR
jgi:hypothetical protein